MNPNLPGSMLFQWHITERCNLRCAHCYQENGTPPESSYDELMDVLAEIRRFVKLHAEAYGRPTKALITLTGGEPFVHPHFLDLLEKVAEAGFASAILTNGMSIDRPMADRLKGLCVRYVQVSIEGKRDTHEQIRGFGSFERAMEGVKNLVAESVPAYVSFTAHKGNYLEFNDLIPLGQGENMHQSMLSPDETKRFVELMHETKQRLKRSKTEVAMHRALQFAADGGTPYFCRAGWSLLTLLPGGLLVPCRRMPIPIGNFLESGLWELYQESEKLKDLRDPQRNPESCRSCFFVNQCRGGLKCLSAAVTGDPWNGDPGCWIRSRKQAAEVE